MKKAFGCLAGLGLLLSWGCGDAGSAENEAGAGAGNTGGAGPDLCAQQHVSVTPAWLETLGPQDGSYDGPAIIERSTARDLIVYFETATADAAAAPIIRRVKLSRLEPMPILPVGAEVWLSKHPAGTSSAPIYQPPPAYDFSVLAAENGPLLFGSAFKTPVAPLKLIDKLDTCTIASNICVSGETTFQALVLEGDTQVTIDDAQTGTVPIDGIDYDVRVSANRTTTGDEGCGPDAYIDPNGIYWLDVQAKDLATLAEGLVVGDLPSCAQGNAEAVEFGFGIYNASVSAGYDGPVVYRGIDDEVYPGSLLFDVPELPDQGFGTPVVYLDGAEAAFAPPSPGATFWLSYTTALHALRESEQGPLLLLDAYGLSAPLDPTVALQLQGFLGVSLTAEPSCDYVSDYSFTHLPAQLWELVFATDPPVRAKSGEITALTLDGRDYEVWVWGEKYVSVTLHAL